MRLWLFHPIIFYPLCAALAAAVILFSIQPQSWPHPAAPAAGAWVDGALVLEGASLDAPAPSPEQSLTVTRDFFGRAQTLRIAQLPAYTAPPAPQDNGAVVLLAPDQAAAIENTPVRVEVTYRPLPVNAASGLAVSLRGAAPGPWASKEVPPQYARVSFTLPAQAGVTGIGLRALSTGTDQSYGLEITRIRITPQTS